MNVFDILESPPLLHAIIVHFPVVLGMVGIPLVFLTALIDTERNVLRWLGVGCYVLLVGCALAAVFSGEQARERVPNTLSPEVYELLEHHEEMAEKVWIPAAATAVFLVLSVVKMRWFRNATMLLAMLASLACAGLVSLTGHYGGTLVHQYGLSGAIMLTTDGMPPEAPPIAAQEPEQQETGAAPSEPAVEEPTAVVEVSPAETERAPAPTETAPAATEEAPQQEVAVVSYTASVQPIFAQHCVGCHGEKDPAGGISLTSVAAMQQPGAKGGPCVVPGKPEESSIIKYLLGQVQPQMPHGKDPLPQETIETLRTWIAGGANDDTPPEEPA